MEEVGFVKSIRNFLIYLDGLPSLKIDDIVQNDQGIRAWVSALLPDRIEALILDEGQVMPGQLFKTTGKKLELPAGEFLLGRSIDPLGVPIDGIGPLGNTKTDTLSELDKAAPGISAREFINKQFDTGVTLVDTLIPLGRGQRELVIGDARSGKTDFLLDLIVNQKKTGVICIFASIGKPVAEVRGLIDLLKQNQALEHTVIIASSSTDLAPLIFLTPQTALSIAEYFQSLGKDVLVILDDMGTHAKIHREISLLGNKSPGRESYPGDIFYQHSHLLERAGSFKKEFGGGSITALPVIELNLNDFTTFIPTNLMSMTDGHLLFRSAFYNQGQRPAIDIPLSVSRVGQQTQNRLQNLLSTHIKQVLAQAGQLETVSRFSFELPMETQLLLKQQTFLEELVKQPPRVRLSKEVQTCLLALVFTSFIENKEANFIRENQNKIIELLEKDVEISQVTKKIFSLETEKQLLDELEKVVGRMNELLIKKVDTKIQTTKNEQMEWVSNK